jgi:hypothetical protein
MLGKLYNETKSGGPSLCQGNTPEMEAVMALRKHIHFSSKKLFILNDGEYNPVYSDGKMSEEQKVLVKNESKYSAIPARILHSLLNGNSFTISSPSDIDIFKNIASALRTVVQSIPFSSFYNRKNLLSKNIEEVNCFINTLSVELDDLDYNSLLKKNRIKIGSFGEIKINSSNKNISLSLLINENEFSILNTEPDTNGEEKGAYSYLYLGQKQWDWKCLSTLICYKCIKQYGSYSSELMNDRIYRSLIDKMRNENWDVMGLGINSKKGKKYLGEKFFTVVDSVKIQQTLLNNIKEIV